MRLASLALGATLLVGCGGAARGSRKTPPPLEPYVAPPVAPDEPSTPAEGELFLRGATVMTAAGAVHAPGYVAISRGRIVSVGAGDGTPSPGAKVVDLKGKFVTPGLIDSHSHLGVYPMPSTEGNEDGNEMVSLTTPQIWAEHGFWPQDPGLWRALAGGITSLQILPGSANLIGGRSFTAKLKARTSARAMRFPGAPQGLKMACGENPKRTYGSDKAPRTRMGNMSGFREQFQRGFEYRRKWQKYERDLQAWTERRARKEAPKDADKPDDPPEPPARELGLETVAAVLDGKILIHNHCYRADEMAQMLDLAKEFGFKIRSFHHAVEAYKLRKRLAEEDVSVSTWADWWGFKMESFDGVPQNASLLTEAGTRTIIHSDSSRDIRRLNQEAAKARAAGRQVGIELTDDQILRWVTVNPAWALGIDKDVGTLEPGKMADVVVWSANPFSVYALAEKVFIDGELQYDRAAHQVPVSDFELGQVNVPELP